MAPADINRVAVRAKALRDGLDRCKSLNDGMLAMLNTFDERLSLLETAIRPVQVRAQASRQCVSNIVAASEVAVTVLQYYDMPRMMEPVVVDGPQSSLEQFEEASERLHEAEAYFEKHPRYRGSGPAAAAARKLLEQALAGLEREFASCLATNSHPLEPERIFESLPELGEQLQSLRSGAEEKEMRWAAQSAAAKFGAGEEEAPPLSPLVPPSAVPRLNAVALRLASKDPQIVTRIYRETRGKTLLASFRKLGTDELLDEDISRLPWEQLEHKIACWIQYLRIAVLVLLAEERKLCDTVLEGLDSHRERCFAELADTGTRSLFHFGEAVAQSQKSPEKLFVLLDMYETMRDLMPEIGVVFEGHACIPIREFAASLMKSLARAAKETFGEFEAAVDKDTTRSTVTDGTVHSITSYVINYIKFLFDYKESLIEIFAMLKRSADTGTAGERLAAAVARILAALLANLEQKAALCKDVALKHLLLMNNTHYMVTAVRKSEQAREVMGDEWIQRHRKIVQQHASAYQDAAWGKAFDCFRGMSNDGILNRAAQKDLKERFKRFNAVFDELHQKQSEWIIPDPELRENVRLSVAEVLLPSYHMQLKRISACLEGSKNPGKYIKFSPELLERRLAEFYEGTAAAYDPH